MSWSKSAQWAPNQTFHNKGCLVLALIDEWVVSLNHCGTILLSLQTSLPLSLLSQQTSALPETMKLLNRKMLRHLNENITIHLLNVFPNWSKLSSSNHCSRSAYYDTLLHCDSTTRWWLLAHVNKGKNFCPEARCDNGESTSVILYLQRKPVNFIF